MKVTVLGAGAYGLALALSFYRNNNEVTVWTKLESEKDEINTTRINKKALPDVIIPNDITITTDLNSLIDSDLIVITIPVSFFRNICLELKDYINSNMHFCIASKGIENNSNSFLYDIFTSIIDTNKVGILSGPTFAIDLANNSPCGLDIATKNNETYELIRNCLENDTLKIIRSNDIIGTQICGAIKNVYAIASGMLEGLNATESTKALFFNNIIDEISTIINMLGGDYKTVYSLSGIGDLLLTCTSNKSRNYNLGLLIGKDNDINNYLENNTVEGYYTLLSIYSIITKYDINTPIIKFLYQVLFENKNKEELFDLLVK